MQAGAAAAWESCCKCKSVCGVGAVVGARAGKSKRHVKAGTQTETDQCVQQQPQKAAAEPSKEGLWGRLHAWQAGRCVAGSKRHARMAAAYGRCPIPNQPKPKNPVLVFVFLFVAGRHAKGVNG